MDWRIISSRNSINQCAKLMKAGVMLINFAGMRL